LEIGYKTEGRGYVLREKDQGSVLGPLQFLIFMNDLEDEIRSSVLKFADDTKIFREFKDNSDCDILQSDLDKLITWSIHRNNKIVIKPKSDDIGCYIHTYRFIKQLAKCNRLHDNTNTCSKNCKKICEKNVNMSLNKSRWKNFENRA